MRAAWRMLRGGDGAAAASSLLNETPLGDAVGSVSFGEADGKGSLEFDGQATE